MTLESQCCNLIQAKRLKELGVTAKSIFSWNGYSYPDYTVGYPEDLKDDEYNAYTVAELGVMLPEGYLSIFITIEKFYGWECWSKGSLMPLGDFNTEAEARAAMLIHVLENKLATPSEVNNKLNQ